MHRGTLGCYYFEIRIKSPRAAPVQKKLALREIFIIVGRAPRREAPQRLDVSDTELSEMLSEISRGWAVWPVIRTTDHGTSICSCKAASCFSRLASSLLTSAGPMPAARVPNDP